MHLSSMRSMTCVENLGMISWMTRFAALMPLACGTTVAPSTTEPAWSMTPWIVAACLT